MQLGKFPTELKVVEIVPLYEEGNKTDAFLIMFSKIYEKILKIRLQTQLYKQNSIRILGT